MISAANSTVESGKTKQLLTLEWMDYKWPLLFLLSMSMMGLKFPLGYIFVPLILISRFRHDRYDFLIMLTIFFGGYGLISGDTLPVKPWDIGFAASLIGAFIYKKSDIVKKTIWLIVIYAACLILIATQSEESMMIQIRTIRNYLFFIYFIIPLIVFADCSFKIEDFFSHIFPYVIILCFFYIIDCYIIGGHILLPCTYIDGGFQSVFYSPIIFGPGSFPRKYPPGLFIAILAIFPLARMYSLRTWQWIVVALALGACRTFSVIGSFLLTYVLCGSGFKKVLQYFVIMVVVMGILVGIDSALPKRDNGESMLRIYSSIEQIMDIRDVVDDEDIAKLGSGRMAQALPKFELVSEYGKELTGLGFLHADLTTNPKFIINNELYIDQERAEEVATGVEIELAGVYLSSGYLGLICHVAFFLFTYLYVRRMRYRLYYISCLFACFITGFGGFSTLNNPDGLFICSMAFSIVLLDDKNKRNEDSTCDMRS